MKKIINIFFAALAIFAVASCTEKGPEQPEENKGINENINFIVKALKVEGTTATIKVEHDGTTENPWYGFLTTETDMMKAYQKKVQELAKNGKIEDINYKTSLTKTFKDLEPNTNYLYIAFGITEECEIYGVPASDKFTTGRNRVQMTANPAWKIEYAGPNKIGETEYKYTAKVTSTDENKYFVTSYSKEVFEMSDIADIAEYELSYLKAFIEAIQQENPNITLNDALMSGNEIEALNIIPGDWYAIAIGVNNKGELSGLYAVSDLINIPLETPTPEYSAWLGTWIWNGANGKTARVTFAQGNPNYTYYLLGWDGYSEQEGPAIMVDWVAEQNSWLIYPSFIGEADLQLSDGSTVPGELYVMGTYETTNGDKYFHGFNYPICAGSIDDNGTKYSIGYEGESEETGKYKITMMEYIAFIQQNGQLGASPITQSELPTFPVVITPADNAAAPASFSPASVKKPMKRTPALSKLPSKKINMDSKVTLR